MKNTSRVFMTLLGGIFLFFALVSHVAAQAVTVTPAMASAQAGSSTWITVSSPFSGDANANSYTVYEYSTSSSGPWTQVCGNATPGESAWRHCAFSGLAPNTAYFVKVTFFDPDGVVGTNPQIIGPVQTAAAPSAAVTVGTASATVQDTYILVSVPISGDSNLNSLPSVEVATGSGGPWTQKCGPYASFSPKLCRIHGLTQGSDYWVRVTVSDPDGVNGSNPQVFGPIQYTGLTNMALGKAITADPGWGCCSNPAQLVDGRIQNVNWNYGFAWTGGTGCWAGGCPPGFKQATIDLGSPQTISRLDWWTHDPGSIPTTWKVLVSTDGVVFTEVFSTTAPACRTATLPLNVSWAFPSCGHLATFTPVTARYVRYTFDDRTLFDGIHGWAVEIEVFAQASIGPICDIQLSQTTFVNGNQVIAQVARLANPGPNPVPVEVKLWFELPGSLPPVPFLTVGADGSFVLLAGSDQDFGPLNLVTVLPSFPRGPYSFNCRLLHAVTGALLGEDFNAFQLQ